MLIAENMLNELSKETDTEYKNNNDDIDFGTVLDFCGTAVKERKIRCSDGLERVFSFDN